MVVQPGTFDAEADAVLDVWSVMTRTFAVLTRQANANMSSGFSPTEWAVLAHLYRHGVEPMAKISQTILITTGNVTYVVDKLVEKGLVRRKPCDSDRRVIYAVLTERGQEVMAELFPGYIEKIKELMSSLDPVEQATLKALLKKLGDTTSNKR